MIGKVRRFVRHHTFAMFTVSAVAIIWSILMLVGIINDAVIGDSGSLETAPSTTVEVTSTVDEPGGSETDPVTGVEETLPALPAGSATTVPTAEPDPLAWVINIRDLDNDAAVLDLTSKCLAHYEPAVQEIIYQICADLARRHLAVGKKAQCTNWPTFRVLFNEMMAVVAANPGDREAFRGAMDARDDSYAACAAGKFDS